MKERNARETNDMRKSESVSVHERRYLSDACTTMAFSIFPAKKLQLSNKHKSNIGSEEVRERERETARTSVPPSEFVRAAVAEHASRPTSS